jgi:hypothetical protein
MAKLLERLNEVSSVTDFEFAQPNANCVLYMPGLPGAGSYIYDRSIYGNHGTIIGATWTRLPSGLWYPDFDGTDDKITIADAASLHFGGNITVKVWIKPDDKDTDRTIIHGSLTLGHSASWWLETYVGKIVWGINGNYNYGGSAVIVEGQLQQIICTYDSALASNNILTYYNGALWDNVPPDYTTDIADDVGVTIGQTGAGSFIYDGGILLLEVLPITWTPSQVMQSFQSERHLLGV